MSHVWAIVQKHIDAYGVREAEIARRMGTAPQTLNSWKNRGIHKLPDARLLLALANITGVAYEDVLNAALMDIRYLPREVVGSAQQPAPKKPEPSGSAPNNVTRLYPTPPAEVLDVEAALLGDPDAAPDETTGEESQDPDDHPNA